MMDTDEITIRKLTKDDVVGAAKVRIDGWKTAYRGIVDDAFLDSLSVEDRAKKFEKHVGADNFIVAVLNGEVVGFCQFSFDNSFSPNIEYVDCELTALYVRPDLKGLGVGTKLFNYVLGEFYKAGKETMILWCLKDNLKSIGFYKHMGGEIKEAKLAKIGNKEYEELGIVYKIRELVKD